MRPANTFQVELKAVFAHKRTLIMKIGFTLLLGLPFVCIDMPQEVQVSGLVFLLIFTSFFGASVTLVRRKTEGHMERLRILPIPKWSVWADFVLSGAVLDFLQMGILLFLFVLIHGNAPTPGSIITTAGIFMAVLLFLNFCGILLGFCMQNNPEVHLIGALCAGLIAFLSGLLPAPGRLEGFIASIAAWNPIALLREALMRFGRSEPFGTVGQTLASLLFLGIIVAVLLLRGVNWKDFVSGIENPEFN